MTQKEKMISLMDDLLTVVHRISNDKRATPQEIAVLPALADSIVHITGYAIIESSGAISPNTPFGKVAPQTLFADFKF